MNTSPTPLTLAFRPITPERYDDMLDILPPALETGLGFLMGEPMDYRVCRVQGTTRAAYSAFVQSGAVHFQASAPMTAPEWDCPGLVDGLRAWVITASLWPLSYSPVRRSWVICSPAPSGGGPGCRSPRCS